MLADLTNDKKENEDSSLMKYRVSQRNLISSFNFENRQVPVTHPVLHRVVGVNKKQDLNLQQHLCENLKSCNKQSLPSLSGPSKSVSKTRTVLFLHACADGACSCVPVYLRDRPISQKSGNC